MDFSGTSDMVTELTELFNCIKQFETDIRTANEEMGNWIQFLRIDEQKAKKVAKVKQKLYCIVQEGESELSHLSEQFRKAKREFEGYDNHIQMCSSRIEAAEREKKALDEESRDYEQRLALMEENVIESIIQKKIVDYKQILEEKKRICAKLGLNDVTNVESRLKSLSVETSKPVTPIDALSSSHSYEAMEVE